MINRNQLICCKLLFIYRKGHWFTKNIFFVHSNISNVLFKCIGSNWRSFFSFIFCLKDLFYVNSLNKFQIHFSSIFLKGLFQTTRSISMHKKHIILFHCHWKYKEYLHERLFSSNSISKISRCTWIRKNIWLHCSLNKHNICSTKKRLIFVPLFPFFLFDVL